MSSGIEWNANTNDGECASADKPATRLERSASRPHAVLEKVTLNVGGTVFQARRDTLERDGPNYFTKALEGSRGPLTLFVDRDPEVFKHILNYLRGYQLAHVLKGMSARERMCFVDDAYHYELRALIEQLVMF